MYLDAILVLIDKEIEENKQYMDHLERLIENPESSEDAKKSYQESIHGCKIREIVLSNFKDRALETYREFND